MQIVGRLVSRSSSFKLPSLLFRRPSGPPVVLGTPPAGGRCSCVPRAYPINPFFLDSPPPAVFFSPSIVLSAPPSVPPSSSPYGAGSANAPAATATDGALLAAPPPSPCPAPEAPAPACSPPPAPPTPIPSSTIASTSSSLGSCARSCGRAAQGGRGRSSRTGDKVRSSVQNEQTKEAGCGGPAAARAPRPPPCSRGGCG